MRAEWTDVPVRRRRIEGPGRDVVRMNRATVLVVRAIVVLLAVLAPAPPRGLAESRVGEAFKRVQDAVVTVRTKERDLAPSVDREPRW